MQGQLSGRVLVEFVEHDGTLYAVVLTRDRCRLQRLGPVSETARQLAALHFALSRLATRRSRPATLEGAAGTLTRAARRADSLLIAPLMAEIDIADESAGREATIVLVPTGQLHAMPWAMLPLLAGRSVSVAPSAALWLRHVRQSHATPRAGVGSRSAGPTGAGTGGGSSGGGPTRGGSSGGGPTRGGSSGGGPTRGGSSSGGSSSGGSSSGGSSSGGYRSAGRTVLVAGPGIPSATDEIAQIEASYAHPVVLAGAEATAEAVLQALGAAEVAHIAAHGRFRADNALFSALELADGPLTVYELERIEQPPRLVVLSACDGGRAQVHPGDELMGTTAALLSIGTGAIIASVAPVPDAGAPPLMASFHKHLGRSGSSPATALAWSGSSPATALAWSGFSPATALARSQADAGVHELDAVELAAGSPAALRALAGSVFVCFGAG